MKFKNKNKYLSKCIFWNVAGIRTRLLKSSGNCFLKSLATSKPSTNMLSPPSTSGSNLSIDKRNNVPALAVPNSTRWQRMKQDLRPNDVNPFITHPAHETELLHTTRVYAPYSFNEQQCGFFYVPKESQRWKSCQTDLTVCRPYPGRLESGLTICRCHSKGSPFSSVILRPCVFVGPGFNPRPPARQTGAYPIELTGRRY